MAKCCIDRPDGLSSRPLSVFHPANVTSDGWEAPQTPQSHSPAINSCATDLIPRPSVPKSQVEVGWGCILSCMRTCCIGCILYTYSPLASSRLACHAIQRIQPIQPYSHTRHTSYSAIQPPSEGGLERLMCLSEREPHTARDAEGAHSNHTCERNKHNVGMEGGKRNAS